VNEPKYITAHDFLASLVTTVTTQLSVSCRPASCSDQLAAKATPTRCENRQGIRSMIFHPMTYKLLIR